jgi:arogenate/prephenate dehydratase
MQAIAPSTPNTLKSLTGAIRPSLSRLVVQSVYRSDSVNFPNGVGLSRADWQSSCAILTSNVVSQEQPKEKPGAAGGARAAAGGADHVAAVNGHKVIFVFE